MTSPSSPSNSHTEAGGSMVERVALAIADERERWGGRTNKSRADGRIYEVCRFDDSGLAGSFSEVHGFANYAESCAFMERMLAKRPAGAAIDAMQEPTEAMLDAACEIGPDTNSGPFSYDAAREVYGAMIGAALAPQVEREGSRDEKPNGNNGK